MNLAAMTRDESSGSLKDWLMFRRVRLSYDNNFMFLPNGKAMSGSVDKLILHKAYDPKRQTDGLVADLEKMTDETLDKIYKFTVVRNPWDRLVSAYFYLKGTRIYNQSGIGERASYKVPLKPTKKTFQDFLVNFLNKYGTYFYVDFRNQYDAIYYNGKKIVNDIFFYENMKPFPDFVSTKSLPHLRRGPKKKHYSYFYNKTTMKIVNNLYQDEIQELGYKYED